MIDAALAPPVPAIGCAMTVKRRVIFTAIWIGVVFLIGIAGFVYIVVQEPSRSEAAQRAGMLGGGLGVVAAIGCGILWLPHIAEVGRRNREKRQRRGRR